MGEQGKQPVVFIVLIIADLVFIVMSICLHVLGLFLMFKVKRNRKNLHTILIHLSFVELITQVCRLGSAVYFYLYDNNEGFLGYQMLRTLTIQGWCVVYVLVMIVVALDPLLIVTLKTGYKKYVNKKKLNIILGICWALGITYALVNFAFPYLKREEISKTFTFPILTSVFLIFSLLSYAMIYKHIQDHNKKLLAGNPSTRATSRPTLKFRVPMLIILTFFLFIAIPTVAQILMRNKLTKIILLVLGILFSIGFICDALIYLFLHPTTKKLLYLHTVCFKKKRHSMDINEFTSRNSPVLSPQAVRGANKIPRLNTPYLQRPSLTPLSSPSLGGRTNLPGTITLTTRL